MGIRKREFNFYGFLDDELFDSGLGSYIGRNIEYLTPHEVYDGFSISKLRKCGTKYTTLINNIIERYRKMNPKHFCECDEPLLEWYEFCPVCGKAVQNE